MLRRSAFALVLFIGVAGVCYAGDIIASITKVEGDKVTYKKATFHRDKNGVVLQRYTFDEPVTVEVSKDVAVTQGHFLPADGPMTTEGRMKGKAKQVEGGLRSDVFKRINDGKALRPSLITIADKGDEKGKITAINLWTSGSPK